MVGVEPFLNVVNAKFVNKISLPGDLDSRLRSLDGSFRDKKYWDSSDNPFLVFFEILCETATYNQKNILIIINSIDSINEEPSNLGNNAYLLLDAIHNIYLNQDSNTRYKLTFLLQGLKSPEDNITESRYTNFLHEFTLKEESISSDQSNNSITSLPVPHTSTNPSKASSSLPIDEPETIESPQNSNNDKNINEAHKCTRIKQSLLAIIASAIFLSPELRTQIEGIVIFLFAIVSFVLEARLFSWFKDKILDRLCKILKNIWNLFPRLFLFLFILSLVFAFVFHCKIPILKAIIPWCTSCRIADVQDINTNLNTFYGGDQLEALKQSINTANKVLEQKKRNVKSVRLSD